MKVKELRKYGFEAVVNARGEAAFVLPAVELSEAMASALAKPQLLEMARRGVKRAQDGVARLEKELAQPPATP